MSCQPTNRTRSLGVAESIVTVIVPFEGIAWLITMELFGTAIPLIAVMKVAPAPTPSPFLSWFVSQKL